MVWQPIQQLSPAQRQSVVARLNAFLNYYNTMNHHQPIINTVNVPVDPGDTRLICFQSSKNNISTTFQCMENNNLNRQGCICLYNTLDERVVFARRLNYNEGRLFSTMGGPDFFATSLNEYLTHIVTEAGDIFDVVPVDQAGAGLINNRTRFVLFELSQQQGAAQFNHFRDRLDAFLDAKYFVITSSPPPPPPWESPMIAPIRTALKTYRNVVVEGVPGTGKTWYARELSSRRYTDQQQDDETYHARWITFHPAVAYEDFVEGIRPGADRSNAMVRRRWFWENGEVGDGGGFAVRDGFFLRVCQEACRNPRQNYLVVIDEINRANLPNVLGDLLTLLEKDKRVTFPEPGEAFEPNDDSWVTLPYSGRRFAVPDNVYVLGTMNTSDKSIAPIDAALRRRFAFLTIEPMPAPELRAKVRREVHPSVEQWDRLNGLLADCLGPDGRLGHSYLLQLGERIRSSNGSAQAEAIRLAWQLELLPQLIDTLTTHGAIELFAADDGRAWLGARGQQTNDGHEVIKTFRGFINSLGFDLVLQGDGHGKGLRVVPTGTETDEPAASAAFAEAAE